jgi:hypothetical protein
MKLLLFVLLVTLQISLCAQTPKPSPSKGTFAPATKEQDLTVPPPEKPKAFTATATEVNASGFVTVEKDGTRTTHNVTKDTEVLQGRKPAQFADIKVGDIVTGQRKRVTETEYELVKITKFVTKHAPPAKPAKK